jgi:hypothetical protein
MKSREPKAAEQFGSNDQEVMANTTITSAKTKWKGRPAVRLANGAIALTALTGGGSIADLRLLAAASAQSEHAVQNALWEAPWPSLDPNRYHPRSHNRIYGPEFVGKFLAAFTGHALCLDYFGAPSGAEVKQGLCLHGEASVNRWKILRQSQSKTGASVVMEVNLPKAGLKFRRELRMRPNETVVYVTETVFNTRAADHLFHWTQHVTLGPPFLAPAESIVSLPAVRAISWPHGYEGKSLLADSKEFFWPLAPAEDGSTIDISRPFVRRGTGFVAAALLNPERDTAYVAALNFRLGVMLGYCFPRKMFPWVAIWEENCARPNSPWNGKTQARGIEFGTTPMPVGKREAFATGSLFGVPTFQCVPASGRLQVNYAIFLAPVNRGWREILDVECGQRAITVIGTNSDRLRLPASDISMIWKSQERT